MNKIILKYLTFTVLCTVLMMACSNHYTEKVTAEIVQPIIPVLTKKQVNPVFKINLTSDTSKYTINKIEIDLNGTTKLSDIKAVGIYGANEKGEPDMSKLLSESLNPEQKVTLSTPIEIETDTISFWVGVSLKDSVDLTHKIAMICTDIETNLGKVKMKDTLGIPLRIGVAVRQKEQDNVFSSRIPCLEISNDGVLMAVFDARYNSPRDLQGHMDIALHRSFDKGATWQPMQIILDMQEWGGLPQKFNGVSDACILIDRNNNDIYVAGLWMHGVLDDNGKWVQGVSDTTTYWKHQWGKMGSQPGTGVKQTSQFLITKSTDNGSTWSKPINITEQTKRPEWWLYAPAPGHGITLSDGTLVFPTQGRDSKGETFSNITWSKDGGQNWTTSNPAYNNTTECMAVELNNGSIMLNMRDNRNRNNKEENGRRICVTTDLGDTWTEHHTSRKALIEPTCMASLHKHKYMMNGEEKSILLFVNPHNYNRRDNISLQVSFDDGNTWPEEFRILLDEYRSAGYSCITSLDENTIGILYESSQTNLAFVQIELSEILKIK